MSGMSNALADGKEKSDDNPGLTVLLERMVDKTDGNATTIGELLDALGTRSFGPMLLLPAVIAVAPTGAIPGMSIVTGTIIFLVSIQILIGRKHIWLPQKVTSFSFDRDRLKSTVAAAKPWTQRLETLFKTRLTFLVDPPATYPVAIICMALAASMFPLALLPFAVAVPGTAIAFFALGLTMRDGLVIALGHILSISAAYLVWTLT